MNKPKKLLAIVLCIAMLVCVLPMGALTAGAESQLLNLTVSDFSYKYLSRVSDTGVLYAQNDEGYYGVINTDGDVLIDFNSTEAPDLSYSDGYTKYMDALYNEKGEKILGESHWGFIEYSNGILLDVLLPTDHPPYRYYDLSDKTIFSINGDGKSVTVQPFNRNGLAVVTVNKGNFGPEKDYHTYVINKSGKIIFDHSCADKGHWVWNGMLGNDGWIPMATESDSDIITFVNYLTGETKILNGLTSKLGVDTNKIHIIYVRSNDEEIFTDDNLVVLRNNDSDTYFLYDIKNDNIIAQHSYIGLNRDSELNLIETTDGKFGYMDRSGNVLKLYDDATDFFNGYAMVKIDGMLYVIDEDFNIVSNGIEGDSAMALYNNYFSVKRGDNCYLVKLDLNKCNHIGGTATFEHGKICAICGQEYSAKLQHNHLSGAWKKDSKGWWYKYTDGCYPKNSWQQIVVEGWGEKWYHFDASGYMQTGWIKSGKAWYYLDSSGAMVTEDWIKDGGKWYYFDKSGIMVTRWQEIYDYSRWEYSWYYFNGSGAMQTGWQKIGNAWYYFNNSGAMLTNWQKIGGTWYYFKSSGAMQTGWFEDADGTWYYFKSGGAMQTGWLKLGGTWYYFTGSGAMVTGNRTIGGKVYRFNSSGACLNP